MADQGVTLRWHGQSCITIVSPNETTVLIDPFEESIGYRLPDVEPDVVITTHRHYDHANVKGVRGNPRVLHGIGPDGAWVAIDETVGDVRLRTVGAYHDEVRGAKRGLVSIVIVETGGLHIVHCGDLGHILTPDQVCAIGTVDVLLVPVGGVYTVAAAEAREVVRQLAPHRAIIPIHYQTEPLTIKLDPLAPFLKGWRRVRPVESNEVRFEPGPVSPDPNRPEVIALHWRSHPQP